MLRSTSAGACALAVFLSATTAWSMARAQPAADAAALGMTLAELQAAYPTLQRVARPVVAPHGLRGQWRLDDRQIAGLPFETTFFMQGQRVQRIEQLRIDTSQPCAQQDEFSAVVHATGLQYGGGVTGFASTGVDAFGTVGDADVSAHLQVSAAMCSIRVVYKPTVLRDASTL
ncbi:hypothetical protein [Rhodoferax koreensis]|nr:hypothetical protein [Rhodoferax koreense]